MRIAFLGSPSFPQLAALRGDPEVALSAGETRDALRDSIGEADVVLVAPRAGALLGEILPDATRARWVHALAAGVESLPFDALRERGVVLTNSAGVFADALGEFAIAAMLWFTKDLRRLARNQEGRRWEPFTVERLEGKSVGIIGYGGIGRAVAHRAAALGMNVLALRRRGAIDDPVVARAFPSGEIDALVAASDFLVLSTPLTPSTRGMIDAARIAKMRREAVLVNVGRGAVVDEAALVAALQANAIRGAALDVFEHEPLPAGSPLWALDNVLLSPHTADHTADSHDRAMAFFLGNLARFRRGVALCNVVDLAAGY